jgi:hypothetical protein
VAQLLGEKIEVGRPVVLGSLSVFPLMSETTGKIEYVTGPEAFDKNLVKVTELDPPQVPLLIVENLAPLHLLLVEGETLVGGNQNRTLNTTVFLASASITVVPVSCVEAGRWGGRRDVVRSRSHLPGSLRAAKTASLPLEEGPARWRSDQGLVWGEVDHQAARHGVVSETAALEDVQRSVSEVRLPDIDDVRALPGQVGIVCASGERVLGLDLFDRPESLRRYLKGLVDGYRLDADDGARPTLAEEIERFLGEVDASTLVAGPAVGEGEELRLAGVLTGIGLRVEGDLVHVAAFPHPGICG